MKHRIPILLLLLMMLAFTSCMNSAESKDSEEPKGESGNQTKTEESAVEPKAIYIEIGEHLLTAELEDNTSANALMELLEKGPLTISASNYGGFEKVCSLETNLPREDRQMTTHAGDICLYSGNQMVLFYGSNSWAYTRLGRLAKMEESEIEDILSGTEREITLSLEAPR